MIDAINAAAIPPAVANAINAVMAAVPKLAKTEKNTHGNYNFAGIDDFLEAVRPLCSAHGLIIVQDEESFDLREAGAGRDGRPAVWLVVRFRFTLAHSSGETWSHSPARSIMVSASMGAQAFGAAQSYALKQFMRSLFQIATGEKGEDADTHQPAELPTRKASPPGISKFREETRKFHADMRSCATVEELDLFITTSKAFIQRAANDFSDDYNGDGGDIRGLAGEIDAYRDRLGMAAAVPAMIPVPDMPLQKDRWAAWCPILVRTIQDCPVDRIDGWLAANEAALGRLKGEFPASHLRLMEKIEAARTSPLSA